MGRTKDLIDREIDELMDEINPYEVLPYKTERQSLILKFLYDKPRTNTELRMQLEANGIKKMSSIEMRKEIHNIRLGMIWGFIEGSKKGYSFIYEKNDLEDYERRFTKRIESQQMVLDALRDMIKHRAN